MTVKEISAYLCFYDKRNPNNDLELIDEDERSDKKTGECYCDNCFYGRTKLANELLKFKNQKKSP